MKWYPSHYSGGGTENKTVTFDPAEKRENIKSGEKHKTIFGKIARWFADLKTVAFTGNYSDLSGKPSSLPASDVPAWAKAANKPSYNWSEIGSKPSAFTPASHKHGKADITDFPSSLPASDVKAWAKAANKPSYTWSEIGSKPQTFPPASHTHSGYVDKTGDTINGQLVFSKKSDRAPVRIMRSSASVPLISLESDTGDLNIYSIFAGYKFEYAGTNRSIIFDLSQGYRISTDDHGTDLLNIENSNTMIGSFKINSLYSNQVLVGPYSKRGENNEKTVNISTYDDGGYIQPNTDGSFSLGSSGKRWKYVYAQTPSISTSDRKVKKEISYTGGKEKEYTSTYMDDAQLISLILGLKPCVYKFKENDSNRPHHGLIAQDVEKLLQKLGIKDHAVFIKSPKTRDVEVEEEYTDKDGSKKTRKRTVQEEIPGEYIYGLRYEEFISDIIRFCQILYSRNTELETALEEQKKKAESLEKRIKVLEDIIKQAA